MVKEGNGRRRLLHAWRESFEGTLAASDEPALIEALDRAVAQGRTAWPNLVLDAERFVAYVARRLPADAPVLASLGRLQHAELYLCCACCAGDPAALAAFDQRVAGDIDLALKRVRGVDAVADDVRQILRQRYLLGDGDSPPRLGQYTGQGSLGGWVRVAAVREAHRLLGRSRELPLDTQRLAVVAGTDDDLELGYLKRAYRSEFRKAFAGALDALSPRDRNLLRYRYIDDLNIGQIGKIYGVHRATVARWLAAIRADLLAKTRAHLAAHLAIDPAEVDSVMRLIDSQLPTSVVAYINPGSDDPADGDPADADR